MRISSVHRWTDSMESIKILTRERVGCWKQALLSQIIFWLGAKFGYYAQCFRILCHICGSFSVLHRSVIRYSYRHFVYSEFHDLFFPFTVYYRNHSLIFYFSSSINYRHWFLSLPSSSSLSSLPSPMQWCLF